MLWHCMTPFAPIQIHGILCFGGNVAWAKRIFQKLAVYGVLWYPDHKVCWVSCSTWSAVSYAMAFIWCQKMKNSGNFISWVTCGTEIFNMKLVLSSVFWLILRGKKLVWATWVSKVTREGRCLWNTAHLFWLNGNQMLKISYRNSWKHRLLCSSIGFRSTYRLGGKLSAL